MFVDGVGGGYVVRNLGLRRALPACGTGRGDGSQGGLLYEMGYHDGVLLVNYITI